MSDNQLLITFRSELSNFSLEQLRYISAVGVWSIGQMYDHLIVVANEYLDNMETCSTLNKEQPLGKTQFGQELYRNRGFPPIKIRLPDELNSPPNNSNSMEDLIIRMDQLIERYSQLKSKVEYINPCYKVEHGGFGWLNAREWCDLVGMHFRHHLRQKDELKKLIM
ncbi:DinB family protein [Psychrobacillus psychrodurans]|uniref:DinB family protein n=1 Tax=Psychrobacillus psychrodurans TaxID=126157 RepID=UPI0008E1BA66|nr:DinB family protein [Psychrobacillus psychrodurans]MCZ8541815.1 DinB family protein [Psychrobacillus psychrodurans]SFN12631.1 DinB superfamily protein [Psychrobacillus psychrodurans]